MEEEETEMKIEGFTDDQLAALCEIWHLGSPIDVIAFFDRLDIPVDSKDRVREVGIAVDESDEARGVAYQSMQEQIIIEVAKLDKQHWNPLGAPKGQ